MFDEYTLYLAVVKITECNSQTMRFGHYLGWLFETEDYELIESYGEVKSATNADYDTGRALGIETAKTLSIPFSDAVKQHGTKQKKSVVEQVMERQKIAALKKATRQVNRLRDAIKKKDA